MPLKEPATDELSLAFRRSAVRTDVGRGAFEIKLKLRRAKVVFPSVDRKPASETGIQAAKQTGESGHHPVGSAEKEHQLPLPSASARAWTQEGKRTEKHSGPLMGEPGCAGDQGTDVGLPNEWVYVSTASPKPAIDVVRKCGGVWHRHIEKPFRLHHAAEFGHDLGKGLHVLQRVICDDGIKRAASKRQERRIRTNRSAGTGSQKDIEPHHAPGETGVVKTSSASTHVKDNRIVSQQCEDFSHSRIHFKHRRKAIPWKRPASRYSKSRKCISATSRSRRAADSAVISR